MESNSFLEHHGIKGQKWGIRRYQNEDGSLTPEGRERYLKGMTSTEKEDYLKTDDHTRIAAEKYMDQGLTYTEALEQVRKDRQERNKKLLITGAAAVTTMLAAYGGYKLYKHLGSEAEKAREFYRTNSENAVRSVDSTRDVLRKNWENKDLEEYKNILRRQGEENASAVTRGSMLRDKLGLQSRSDHDRAWRQNYERQSLEQLAERRADLNRRIKNQRDVISGYEQTRNGITRNRDEAKWRQMGRTYDADKYKKLYSEADAQTREKADRMITLGQQTLEELLRQRRMLG